MLQIQELHAQALILTNSLSFPSYYYHCASSNPAVCKSVSHNSKRHREDKIEGGITLFDR